MPLTEFQRRVAQAIAVNRSEDSHLAGGAALHFAPNSRRYSNDLGYFHDSTERVATAFDADRRVLTDAGYAVIIDMNQPGFVRARVQDGTGATKVEWAHDSAWRFMPTVRDAECGYRLHAVDVAVNKVLALAGRNEARDLVDIAVIDDEFLPLGALCWAASGKDPGFTPLSLLELLRRRGRHQPEEFGRLHLAVPIDLVAMKRWWLEALDTADTFIRSRPGKETGCLYYATNEERFVAPTIEQPVGPEHAIVAHYGQPGGVLPRLVD
jgi:hypothetical protein